VKIVVAGASPLIVIARSGLLFVLTGLADAVVVPQTVYDECAADVKLPGARAIRSAVEARQIEVRPDAPIDDLAPELDVGERAAIALAFALQCPILIDERLGREVARRRGLTVVGSAGLLVEAKRRGLIPAVAPVLEEWARCGYYLGAALVRKVLRLADEA
jgi:predicted nucleic acid-binding protein